MTTIIIDTRTNERGTYADWVARFIDLWSGPAKNVERFMDVLGPDVRLIAPGVPMTVGHDAGRRAFRRLITALPDMRGEVLRWSASGDTLFIEMTFTATIGRRLVTWSNADRFRFVDGVAVERVAYFDPTSVRMAFLTSMRGWRQFATILWG